MAKITLDGIVSGFKSVAKLISNFDSIEDNLNNKVLYRDNPEGEPNQMEGELDMNSNRILNLPTATSATEPVTYGQFTVPQTPSEFDKTVVENQVGSDAVSDKFTLTLTSYSPGLQNLSVYINGVRQLNSTYTETSPTEITFGTTPVDTDEYTFVVNEVNVDNDFYRDAGGRSLVESFVATAGQTVITLANTYTQYINNVSVYRNGVRQSDFVETSPSSITLTDPASAGDEIVVIINEAFVIQGTSEAANVVYTPQGAGAVGTNVQAKLQQVVSVKDFGAAGDGVTDDTAAFNAAFAWLRTTKVVGEPIYAGSLTIPPGVYKCEDSINATDLRGGSWSVEADGAVIESHATGKVALDMFYTRFGNIRGLTIVGDSTNTPAAGIAIGRDTSGVACDVLFFENVSTQGHFSIAAFYNYASETTTFNHCRFYNEDDGANSYCLGIDGTYKLAVPSDFRTMPAGEVAASFNECAYMNIDCRKSVSGPCVYVRRAARHRFYAGYVVSWDDSAFVMDTDAWGSKGLYFDVHCETNYATATSNGLLHCFRFQGNAVQQHKSFTFMDHAPHARNSIFQMDTAGTYGAAVTSVKFTNGHVAIDDFSYGAGAPITTVFNDKTVVDFQGCMYIGDESNLHTNIDRGVYSVEMPNKDIASYGVGTQTITTDVDDFVTVKGSYRFCRHPGAAGVVAGDLPLDGVTEISGRDGVGFHRENDTGVLTEFSQIDSASIVDTTGSETGELLLETINGGTQSQASLTVGAGAPTHTPSTSAGLYLRVNGTSTTTLYVWDGSSWTAK